MRVAVLAYRAILGRMSHVLLQDTATNLEAVVSTRSGDVETPMPVFELPEHSHHSAVSNQGFEWVVLPEFGADGNQVNALVVDLERLIPSVAVLQSMLTSGSLPAPKVAHITGGMREAGLLLAAALVTLRRRLQIPLSTLAARTEIAPEALHHLERGRGERPRPAVLRRLADALGVPVGKLQELAGVGPPLSQGTERYAVAFHTWRKFDLHDEETAHVLNGLISDLVAPDVQHGPSRARRNRHK